MPAGTEVLGDDAKPKPKRLFWLLKKLVRWRGGSQTKVSPLPASEYAQSHTPGLGVQGAAVQFRADVPATPTRSRPTAPLGPLIPVGLHNQAFASPVNGSATDHDALDNLLPPPAWSAYKNAAGKAHHLPPITKQLAPIRIRPVNALPYGHPSSPRGGMWGLQSRNSSGKLLSGLRAQSPQVSQTAIAARGTGIGPQPLDSSAGISFARSRPRRAVDEYLMHPNDGSGGIVFASPTTHAARIGDSRLSAELQPRHSGSSQQQLAPLPQVAVNSNNGLPRQYAITQAVSAGLRSSLQRQPGSPAVGSPASKGRYRALPLVQQDNALSPYRSPGTGLAGGGNQPMAHYSPARRAKASILDRVTHAGAGDQTAQVAASPHGSARDGSGHRRTSTEASPTTTTTTKRGPGIPGGRTSGEQDSGSYMVKPHVGLHGEAVGPQAMQVTQSRRGCYDYRSAAACQDEDAQGLGLGLDNEITPVKSGMHGPGGTYKHLQELLPPTLWDPSAAAASSSQPQQAAAPGQSSAESAGQVAGAGISRQGQSGHASVEASTYAAKDPYYAGYNAGVKAAAAAAAGAGAVGPRPPRSRSRRTTDSNPQPAARPPPGQAMMVRPRAPLHAAPDGHSWAQARAHKLLQAAAAVMAGASGQPESHSADVAKGTHQHLLQHHIQHQNQPQQDLLHAPHAYQPLISGGSDKRIRTRMAPSGVVQSLDGFLAGVAHAQHAHEGGAVSNSHVGSLAQQGQQQQSRQVLRAASSALQRPSSSPSSSAVAVAAAAAVGEPAVVRVRPLYEVQPQPSWAHDAARGALGDSSNKMPGGVTAALSKGSKHAFNAPRAADNSPKGAHAAQQNLPVAWQ